MVKNYLPSIPITVPGSTHLSNAGMPGVGRSEERRPPQNNLF